MQLNVTGSLCEIVEPRDIIAAGSVGVFKAEFAFDEVWDGLTKTAVFINRKITRSMLLDVNDECIIPWEVLEHSADIYIGCVGVDETKIITTNPAGPISITLGVDPSADPGAVPTPTEMQQIIALFNTAASAAVSAARQPYVGVNGNWYIYDIATEAYVDSGHASYGDVAVWHHGTAVTGTGTGISAAVTGSKAGDMYLNDTTLNLYRATAVNTWDYASNIAGSLGTRLDTAEQSISQLDAEITVLNCINLLSKNGTFADATTNGVTIEWADKENCTLIGTATGYANFNIVSSASSLPSWLTAGNTYKAIFETTDLNVIFQIITYVDGTSTSTDIASSQEFIIPSNCTGIIIRLRANNSSANYNAAVNVKFLNTSSNEMLNEDISQRIYSKDANVYADGSNITLSDILEDGFYVISDSLTVLDAPSWLTVTGLKVENYSKYHNGGFVKQTVESLLNPETSKRYMRISASNGIFSDWIDITDESAYLIATGNQTDRTEEIVDMLNTYGICKLGKGIYYVSGVTMPNNSSIVGIGDGTIVRLLDASTDANTVTMGKRCTIENIRFVGADTRQGGSDTIGTRNGIYVATGEIDTSENDLLCKISKCSFIGFNGAGIKVFKTGYYMTHSISISDCKFKFNKVGLYLAEKAEYGVINNCLFNHNYFATRCDGGNNKYSNCGFDANSKGFVIDGTGITSSNNGHGSVVGCSFNHNSIVGIDIKGNTNGMIFDACCIYLNTTTESVDNSISISDSAGVTFANCSMGGVAVTNTNSNGTIFNGCRFAASPTISGTVTLTNCTLLDGTAVIS